MAAVRLLGLAPDMDQSTPGMLTECNYVIPSYRGMKAAPQAVDVSIAALAAAARGLATLQLLDGSLRVFAGTQTKLYEASGATWNDVSKVGDYTGSSESRWSFAQFGNVSLASDGVEVIQYSDTSGDFDDISGAPIAKIIFAVNGFVMALNYNDGTSTPDGWYCSAFQDYTDWTPSPSTQCTTGRLFGIPGPFTAGIRFGSDALAFKRGGLYLGRYAGTPVVWQWSEIPGQTGCVGQEALCDVSTDSTAMIFFVGPDNFYIYDGTRPVPVGTGKVRRYWLNRVSQTFIYKTICAYDYLDRNVYIFYPSVGSATGALDECLVFNVQTQMWGKADRTVEAVNQYQSGGLTWDGLGTAYSTWDDLPEIPYDSPFWTSGTRLLSAFDSSHQLQQFTGIGENAQFQTGFYGMDDAYTTCQGLTPRFFVKPDTSYCIFTYKNDWGDVTSTAGTTYYYENKYDIVSDARWHQFTISSTGNMEVEAITPRLQPSSES